MDGTKGLDPLVRDLVEILEGTRQAERELFAALPDELRERPIRAGDWSPKDHMAHLAAWKERQADRYDSVRRGEDPTEGSGDETDAINAELQRATAHLSWDETVQAAEAAHERLVAAIRACDPDEIRESGRLIDGTFGNGPYHALQHFTWLREAGLGIGSAPSIGLSIALEQVVERGTLPDSALGVALYNSACYLALGGELQRARALLPRAFRLRPDLVELARDDSDLAALSDEISELAAQ
ncbi:MAG TPA: DinB family protein [Candidatus Limnocylindrales bacterium]|nr:DinB family protein [Candidatus Limnocylindrales bacterium]